MKRSLTAAICASVLALTLAGCGSTRVETKIETEKYTPEDFAVTNKDIYEMLEDQGYVLDKVTYLGDKACSDEVPDILNGTLYEDFTDCIGYSVDYHSSRNPIVMARKLFAGKSIEMGKTEGQLYWFARTEGGEWEMVCEGDVEEIEYTE